MPGVRTERDEFGERLAAGDNTKLRGRRHNGISSRNTPRQQLRFRIYNDMMAEAEIHAERRIDEMARQLQGVIYSPKSS